MIQSIKVRNLVTGASITIGCSEKVFILDKVDWDSPSVSFQAYRVPNEIGQNLLGTIIENRQPSIKGYVIADTANMLIEEETWDSFLARQEEEINESKLELDKIFSVNQDVIIDSGEYHLKARPMAPVKYSTNERENNEVLCAFKIELIAFKPLFYKDEKIVSLAQTEPKFMFPLFFNKPANKVIFGENVRRKSIEIVNEGDVRTGCEITISARGGSVINPKLYNISTGNFLAFENVTLNDSDYLVIKTEVGEEDAILHSSSLEKPVSLVGNIGKGSKFLQVEQGNNFYGYEVDSQSANNVEVYVKFTEKYFNIRGM